MKASAVLFALRLDALLPAAVAPRRPVPAVRTERAGARALAHLGALAGRLTAGAHPEPALDAVTDLATAGSRTVGGGSGAVTVWFGCVGERG